MRPRSLFVFAALIAATSTTALSSTPEGPASASAVIDGAFAAVAAGTPVNSLPGTPPDALAYAIGSPVSIPAGVPADSPASPLVAAPPRPTIVITVDKAAQRMSVRVNGEQRWNWPVSTGQRGHATPRGTFKPIYLSRHHRSREWNNAPMPYAIFFTNRGHAIHASDATWRLGSPASHGCVRLSNGNARQLFALVQQHGVAHTQVVIAGTEQKAVARTNATPKAQGNARVKTPSKAQAQPPRHATPQRVAGQPTLAARPVNLAP